MREGNVPAFDPNKAATSLAETLAAGAGGGNIAGAGTFYSLPSIIRSSQLLSEAITLTGTLAGTLTLQVDNNPDEQADQLGTASWQTYDRVNLGGFVAGVATLVAGAIVGGTNPGGWGAERPIPWARYRMKLVVTSGTGTIKVHRQLKGALT